MQPTQSQVKDLLDACRRDGSMLREQARLFVEDWLEVIYPRLRDPDTPTSALLAIGDRLIELGDLKPKKEAPQVATGPGFSITINIPQPDGKPPITIEGTSTPGTAGEDEETMHPDFPEFPELPDSPMAARFETNDDLIGRGFTLDLEGDD